MLLQGRSFQIDNNAVKIRHLALSHSGERQEGREGGVWEGAGCCFPFPRLPSPVPFCLLPSLPSFHPLHILLVSLFSSSSSLTLVSQPLRLPHSLSVTSPSLSPSLHFFLSAEEHLICATESNQVSIPTPLCSKDVLLRRSVPCGVGFSALTLAYGTTSSSTLHSPTLTLRDRTPR